MNLHIRISATNIATNVVKCVFVRQIHMGVGYTGELYKEGGKLTAAFQM